MKLVMASFHLESDTREDAPQWIRDLRPSSSQLKILVYPEFAAPTGLVPPTRSDGITVSVPTVGPHGLAILLADAAT
ncbi:gypsy type transposase [Tanacetum coccineum]